MINYFYTAYNITNTLMSIKNTIPSEEKDYTVTLDTSIRQETRRVFLFSLTTMNVGTPLSASYPTPSTAVFGDCRGPRRRSDRLLWERRKFTTVL